jgi:DNA-binding transcriptional LysR family regulator
MSRNLMKLTRIPTLDQLNVFLTVVDVGSFAGAARKLNRATSVVSYMVSNLEAYLGFPLFERDTTRKPRLTEAGRSVLSETRNIAMGVDRLHAKAQGLLQGLEPRVSIVLDMMLPASRSLDVLKSFRLEFPAVPLHVRTEGLGAVAELIMNGTAMIGVCGPPDSEIAGLERIGIGSVELVPVAAPHHPLAMATQNPIGAGRHHMQIVLTDRSDRTKGVDTGVVGINTWRVADLATKHMLLVEGVGWGNMPVPTIREDLRTGRLVRINLSDVKGGAYRFFAIHRSKNPLGPAARFLIERLISQVPEWEPSARDVHAL